MQIVECFKFGWQTFKSHTVTFALVGIALALAQLVAHVVLVLLFKEAGSLISHALWGLFWGGYLGVARKATRGQKPTIADGFLPLLRSPGGLILTGLALSCGIFAGGIGILITAPLFVFAPLHVVGGARIGQALFRSTKQVLAHPKVFELCALLAMLNVIGALCFALGLLITLPLSALVLVRAQALSSTPALANANT